MLIGAINLLNKYGSPLGVAKALLEGKLSSSEQDFVDEIVSSIILEAAKFQLEQEQQKRNSFDYTKNPDLEEESGYFRNW